MPDSPPPSPADSDSNSESRSRTTVGAYGEWAATRSGPDPRPLSFRHENWTDVDRWRTAARAEVEARIAPPETGTEATPDVTVDETDVEDGLRRERVSWQLPYGPRTEAFFLRPEDAGEPLPGVLALHDHGGNKYHGKEKIARGPGEDTAFLRRYRDELYDGAAWANRLARRGYAVLVPDVFPFGSRRVDPRDTVEGLGRPDPSDDSSAGVEAYNEWAGRHESVVAKALYCGGTTFPGVALAEDRRALDALCDRSDVDEDRVGIAGLSGGGLRTVYLGGLDDRVASAACVCMMTTWEDFVYDTCQKHTWMIYPPLLPRAMNYPDILSMRAPKPTFVLDGDSDPLFTRSERDRAGRMLAETFGKADAAESFRRRSYPGGHVFGEERRADVFEWFDRTLGRRS